MISILVHVCAFTNKAVFSLTLQIIGHCISMGRDPTQSTLVYSNYFYVNDQNKCLSGTCTCM